jgi:hypothetical protein
LHEKAEEEEQTKHHNALQIALGQKPAGKCREQMGHGGAEEADQQHGTPVQPAAEPKAQQKGHN